MMIFLKGFCKWLTIAKLSIYTPKAVSHLNRVNKQNPYNLSIASYR